jgi:hypothetical protein
MKKGVAHDSGRIPGANGSNGSILEEIALSSIPSATERVCPEITEADFEVGYWISRTEIQNELAKNVREVVSRILEPIVDRVAREAISQHLKGTISPGERSDGAPLDLR